MTAPTDISLNFVDDAPEIITPGGSGRISVSFRENASGSALPPVFDADAIDPEGETDNGGGLTWSIVAPAAGGAEQGNLFEIDQQGNIRFLADADFENPPPGVLDNQYRLTVRVEDSAGNFDEAEVNVNVTDINETPVFIDYGDENPTFVEDGGPVVLDSDGALFDPEFAVLNDYTGASLRFERMDETLPEDVFSFGASSLIEENAFGGLVEVGSIFPFATFTNAGGVLEILFNGDAPARQDLVDEVLRIVSYEYASEVPPITGEGVPPTVFITVSALDNVDEEISGTAGGGVTIPIRIELTNAPVSLFRGGELTDEFNSIQASVLAAQAGDDIAVDRDEYEAARTGGENVVVDVDNLTVRLPAFNDIDADPAGSSIYDSTFTLADGVADLMLTGGSGSAVNGNDSNNTITGNNGSNGINGFDGDDTLIGNGGDDTLDGGLGADRMEGGLGVDAYMVDNVGDIVVENLNGGEFDLVRTSVDYTLSDNVEILILLENPQVISGTGNDGGGTVPNLMLGNEFGNILTTFGGQDVILGQGGDDTIKSGTSTGNMFDIISGGEGADVLTGDLGHDYFVYESINEAGDTITDFTTGDSANNDILDLRPFAFTGVIVPPGGSLLSSDLVAQGFLSLTDEPDGSVRVLIDDDGNANGSSFTELVSLQSAMSANVLDFILV